MTSSGRGVLHGRRVLCGRAGQTWIQGPAGRPVGADQEKRTKEEEPRLKVWRLGVIKEGTLRVRPHPEMAASFPCFPSQASWHHCKLLH